jgi:hypothetical protein
MSNVIAISYVRQLFFVCKNVVFIKKKEELSFSRLYKIKLQYVFYLIGHI